MKNRNLLTFAIAAVVASGSQARIVNLDFQVSLNRLYDFPSSTWSNIDLFSTARVSFDVDDTALRGIFYWEDQVQTIDTYFGTPVIASPFASNLPVPERPEEWRADPRGFSLLTNIDYSISWPDTPLGKGAKISYQMNDGFTAVREGMVWEYLVGFNLMAPGIPVSDIAQRSGDEIVSYLQRSFAEQYLFTVGFNSRVYESNTYANLSGLSYQGTAVLSGVSFASPVPEPDSFALLALSMPLLIALSRVRR